MKRYRFDVTILIEEDQPNLIRNSALLGGFAGLVVFMLFNSMGASFLAVLFGRGAFGGAAYWFYNEKRETIYVRDLLHGRHFAKPSSISMSIRALMMSNSVRRPSRACVTM